VATKNNINSLFNKLRENINCNIKLELPKLINVDYSNVKKWLNGQAIMSKTSYNKIKNIYKI
jgi:hypothetical protein